MKILFIHSEMLDDPISKRNKKKPLYFQNEIQFGISYISAVLKQNNHDTDLFVVTRYTKQRDLVSVIDGFKPKLICFSAVFREYDTVTRVAGFIKNTYPAIFLLAGGPHVSLNPEAAIKEVFDAICIGEGEYPVLELVEMLEKGFKPSNIKNLWIKNGDRIERNPTREFIRDLDGLPFPDRIIWQKWIKHQGLFHVVLLGRGCPFNCTYCCNHALKQVSEGKYVRFRSPDNIISEIKEVVNLFPNIPYIFLEAEAINM